MMHRINKDIFSVDGGAIGLKECPDCYKLMEWNNNTWECVSCEYTFCDIKSRTSAFTTLLKMQTITRLIYSLFFFVSIFIVLPYLFVMYDGRYQDIGMVLFAIVVLSLGIRKSIS